MHNSTAAKSNTVVPGSKPRLCIPTECCPEHLCSWRLSYVSYLVQQYTTMFVSHLRVLEISTPICMYMYFVHIYYCTGYSSIHRTALPALVRVQFAETFLSPVPGPRRNFVECSYRFYSSLRSYLLHRPCKKIQGIESSSSAESIPPNTTPRSFIHRCTYHLIHRCTRKHRAVNSSPLGSLSQLASLLPLPHRRHRLSTPLLGHLITYHMLSLRTIATTSAAALLVLLFCQRTLGFVVSPPALVRRGCRSPRPAPAGASAAATRMSYAPKNVQDVWDNHFAAFGGKDVSETKINRVGAIRSAVSYVGKIPSGKYLPPLQSTRVVLCLRSEGFLFFVFSQECGVVCVVCYHHTAVQVGTCRHLFGVSCVCIILCN